MCTPVATATKCLLNVPLSVVVEKVMRIYELQCSFTLASRYQLEEQLKKLREEHASLADRVREIEGKHREVEMELRGEHETKAELEVCVCVCVRV